ncbi:MAG TPA: hypothetical protein PKD54_10600 [Pirellulaceae bacterium]|nr:hypothetical protein [Pirellulaceae bacterium]
MLISLVALWSAPAAVLAQTNISAGASALFPESTIVYVEANQAGQLLDKLVDHPLRGRIEALAPVQQFLRGPEMFATQMFVGILEAQLEMTWREALRAMTAHGLAMGVDGQSQGVLLVTRAVDGPTLSKIVRTILGWVELQARNENRATPFQMIDYRGHRIARFPEFALGRVDDWFFVSNQAALLQAAMDRALDGATDGLTSSAVWQHSAKMRDATSDVWVVADLDSLRRAGLARELLSGTTDNAGAELLLGGVFEALGQAAVVAANINVKDDGVRLAISMPHELHRISPARSYFFADNQQPRAARIAHVPGAIGQVYAHRDLRGWWQSKEDLFDENVIAQLLQTDSQLSILFAGLDFGNDILGALEPDLQIIVAPQEYDATHPPELKLPAFALVGQLRQPDEIKRRLRIAYQSVIGFVNIQLAMEGYPQLDLVTEARDGMEISAATYVLDARSQRGLVHYNFSPTLAFQGDLLILSSTRSLAEQIASAQDSTTPDTKTNFWLHLEGPALSDVLRLNRQLLVVQNMIEQGTDKPTAEGNVELMLNALSWVQTFDSRLNVNADELIWVTEVQFVK